MTTPIITEVEPETVTDETPATGEETTETSTQEEPSTALTDEYNPDDEQEGDGQANFGYGWGYEDSLDDPEELSSMPSENLDEDEKYALGLDKGNKTEGNK